MFLMGQYQCVFGSVLNFVQVGVVVGCFFLLSFTYFFFATACLRDTYIACLSLFL